MRLVVAKRRVGAANEVRARMVGTALRCERAWPNGSRGHVDPVPCPGARASVEDGVVAFGPLRHAPRLVVAQGRGRASTEVKAQSIVAKGRERASTVEFVDGGHVNARCTLGNPPVAQMSENP